MSDLLRRLVDAELGRMPRLQPRGAPRLIGADGPSPAPSIVEEHVEREWVDGAPTGVVKTRRIDGQTGRPVIGGEASSARLAASSEVATVDADPFPGALGTGAARSSKQRPEDESAPGAATRLTGLRSDSADERGAGGASSLGPRIRSAPARGSTASMTADSAVPSPRNPSVSPSRAAPPPSSGEPPDAHPAPPLAHSDAALVAGSTSLLSSPSASTVRAPSPPPARQIGVAPGDGELINPPGDASLVQAADAATRLRVPEVPRPGSSGADLGAEAVAAPLATPTRDLGSASAASHDTGPVVAGGLSAAPHASVATGLSSGPDGLAEAIRTFAASVDATPNSDANESRPSAAGSPPATPVVRVRIGRIEVHAPEVAASAPPSVERRPVALSLQTLLQRREQSS